MFEIQRCWRLKAACSAWPCLFTRQAQNRHREPDYPLVATLLAAAVQAEKTEGAITVTSIIQKNDPESKWRPCTTSFVPQVWFVMVICQDLLSNLKLKKSKLIIGKPTTAACTYIFPK